jgi:hypothetical protein
VTYSLSDDAGGLFTIDANTGVVTVAGAIDREAAASHDIEVTATSDDGSTSTQSYTINVNDIDEFDVTTPTDANGGANTVAEDASVGTVVGVTASASDMDATNDSVTYSLSDDAGGLFAIDANTGVVTVAGALDYETATGHTIEVTATSADGSTSTENFTIGVTDEDEHNVGAISDTDGTSNAVNENVSVGTTVGITASATDADGTDTVTYSLSDDAGGLFAIDANTGVVTVAGSINRELAASYGIEVTATSDDGSTSTQNYTINVNDIDEFDVGAVTDTDGGANTVAEDATVGTTVGVTALASDADATNSGVTYSLSDDAGGLFSIDANTGEVTVAGALDYETATGHSIEVTATSADGSTSTETFNIGVTDENEAATDMTFTGNADLEISGSATNTLELNTDGGTNDYASVSNVTDFPTQDLTVEVRFTSSTQASSGTPLFSYAVSGNANEFSLYADSSPDALFVEVDGNAIQTTIPSSSLFDGNEHTVSVTYDWSSDTITVYVDGTSEYSTTAGVGYFSTGGTIVLGQEQDSVGGGFDSNQIFDGTMSEVRVFNDVRSSSEIANNYDSDLSNPGSEQGLVTNWQFSSGSTNDLAGGNNLTLNNGASILSDGGPTIAAGSVVADVTSVVDVDAGDTFTFALTDDAGGVFQINSSTGEISLVAEHDASTAFNDTVDVQVTDAGGNTFTETVGINLGTTSGETLTGTSNTDVMYGFGGADTLNGGAGDDILYGDEANGGGGSPTPTGPNLITNGSFENGSTGWTLVSGDGFDIKNDGEFGVTGSDGSKYLDMEYNDENSMIEQTVAGLSNGSDYQLSFDVADMSGYDGEMEIYWNGTLLDTLDPSSSTMTTYTYTVTAGSGDGSDTIRFDEDGDDDWGGVALDNVQLFELTSGGEADTLNGGDGNDTLVGGAGADVLDGGAGTDTVDYSNASEGVDVAFNTVDGSGIDGAYVGETAGGLAGEAEGDSFTSIEAFTGSDHADQVYGGSSDMSFSLGAGDDKFDTNSAANAVDTVDAGAGNDEVWAGDGADVINGGAGNDTIWGEAGNDVINGGTGNDTLWGQDGSDLFTFQMGGGTDTIIGGAGGGWTDTIQLQDASGGNNLGTYGTDWTITLSEGTMSQDANGFDLSDDADGTITLSDGSIANFTDVERIDF